MKEYIKYHFLHLLVIYSPQKHNNIWRKIYNKYIKFLISWIFITSYKIILILYKFATKLKYNKRIILTYITVLLLPNFFVQIHCIPSCTSIIYRFFFSHYLCQISTNFIFNLKQKETHTYYIYSIHY